MFEYPLDVGSFDSGEIRHLLDRQSPVHCQGIPDSLDVLIRASGVSLGCSRQINNRHTPTLKCSVPKLDSGVTETVLTVGCLNFGPCFLQSQVKFDTKQHINPLLQLQANLRRSLHFCCSSCLTVPVKCPTNCPHLSASSGHCVGLLTKSVHRRVSMLSASRPKSCQNCRTPRTRA